MTATRGTLNEGDVRSTRTNLTPVERQDVAGGNCSGYGRLEALESRGGVKLSSTPGIGLNQFKFGCRCPAHGVADGEVRLNSKGRMNFFRRSVRWAARAFAARDCRRVPGGAMEVEGS